LTATGGFSVPGILVMEFPIRRTRTKRMPRKRQEDVEDLEDVRGKIRNYEEVKNWGAA
jgi:hypothetical protein